MRTGRGRYRVSAIAFDTEGLTEGDYDDFRRALGRLEHDFPGVHVLGHDETDSWPSYVIRETIPASRAPEAPDAE